MPFEFSDGPSLFMRGDGFGSMFFNIYFMAIYFYNIIIYNRYEIDYMENLKEVPDVLLKKLVVSEHKNYSFLIDKLLFLGFIVIVNGTHLAYR